MGVRCIICCTRDTRLSYFTFPKDQSRKDEWIKILEIDHTIVHSGTRICSLHFEDKSFVNRRKLRLKKLAVPKKFNVNAIPTENCQSVGFTQKENSTYPNLEATKQISDEQTGNENKSGVWSMVPILFPTVNKNNSSLIKIESTYSLEQIASDHNYAKVENHTNLNPQKNQATISTDSGSGSVPCVSGNRKLEPKGGFGNVSKPQKTYLSTIKSPERKLRSARRELLYLKQRNRRLQKKLDEKLSIKNANRIISELFHEDINLKNFVLFQFKRLIERKSGKKPHLSDYEKTLSLTILDNCGSRGYKSLKELGIKLPTESTIKRWLNTLELKQ